MSKTDAAYQQGYTRGYRRGLGKSQALRKTILLQRAALEVWKAAYPANPGYTGAALLQVKRAAQEWAEWRTKHTKCRPGCKECALRAALAHYKVSEA